MKLKQRLEIILLTYAWVILPLVILTLVLLPSVIAVILLKKLVTSHELTFVNILYFLLLLLLFHWILKQLKFSVEAVKSYKKKRREYEEKFRNFNFTKYEQKGEYKSYQDYMGQKMGKKT